MEKNYPAAISVPIKFLCLVMWPRELVCRWPDLCYIFTTGAGGKITHPDKRGTGFCPESIQRPWLEDEPWRSGGILGPLTPNGFEELLEDH